MEASERPVYFPNFPLVCKATALTRKVFFNRDQKAQEPLNYDMYI